MPKSYAILLGKTVKKLAALRGGGSALPGLLVEKIDKDFISRTLATLPQGVVVVSGTNGKTTTTKMVVELLESQGLRVFTNRTGSNFTRGVAAALLGDVDRNGHLDADIAVLELDEAHAVHFVRTVKPRASLLLNVLRDQLDRFGEIDATAQMLKHIADATSEHIVVNREDPRLLAITANALKQESITYFGLSADTRYRFPSDDDLRSRESAQVTTLPNAFVTLESFKGKTAQFAIDGEKSSVTLKLDGIYNIYNAAAALALVGKITPDFSLPKALETLATIRPAFGRGETIEVNGQPLEIVLVKNPSGFRLGLQSFDPNGYATMIAINDNYADGRDMSWLWDVDFESLKNDGVAVVSGVRGFDMALRLQYDDVAIEHATTDLASGVNKLLTRHAEQPKRIFCTYTAMLAIRKQLAKLTTVEVIS